METTQAQQATAPEWLDAALAVANIPTLACLLVQLTGNRKWIEGRFVPERTRGLDDNDDGGLPADVQEDRKSTRLNSSHIQKSRMPSSA